MALTLEIYSKSSSSNELQELERSFREIFAEKDTHILIAEANSGKEEDADYIVAISNNIKRGNSFIIRGQYLNGLVFCIKKISFSDAIINNPNSSDNEVIIIQSKFYNHTKLSRYKT